MSSMAVSFEKVRLIVLIREVAWVAECSECLRRRVCVSSGASLNSAEMF